MLLLEYRRWRSTSAHCSAAEVFHFIPAEHPCLHDGYIRDKPRAFILVSSACHPLQRQSLGLDLLQDLHYSC